MLPIQRAYLETADPVSNFHQSVILEAPDGIDAQSALEALNALMRHHDALRLRLVPGAAGPGLAIDPPDAGPAFETLDMPWQPAEGARAWLVAALERLAGRLDPTAGRMVAAAWVPGTPDRLLLAIHHLAVDGVSWRILIDDLSSLWRGEPLDAVGASLREWAEHLHAEAPRRRVELALWQDMVRDVRPLATDRAVQPGDNTLRNTGLLERRLPGDLMRRAFQALAAYRLEINDLLVTALGLALLHWQAERYGAAGAPLLIDLEGHGREPGASGLDLGLTVGWLTSVFPVRVDPAGLAIDEALAGGLAGGEALKRTKSLLRRLPDKGLGYGMLRYLDAEGGAALGSGPDADVAFNYLGRMGDGGGTGWRLAADGLHGGDVPTQRRPHLLEINALLGDGDELLVLWNWCRLAHDEAAIAALSDTFATALAALVEHCLSAPPASRCIRGDRSMVDLDDGALAAIERQCHDLEEVLPLTPLQQGLIFESRRISPGAPDPYTTQMQIGLHGELDIARLERAWRALLVRHSVLRLALPAGALEHGVAAVRRDLPDCWHAVDGGELADLLERDKLAGVDLASGLIRLTVLRRGPADHVLVLTNHHAILDGWSTSAIVRELEALYIGSDLARPVRLVRLSCLAHAPGLPGCPQSGGAGSCPASRSPADCRSRGPPCRAAASARPTCRWTLPSAPAWTSWRAPSA